MKQAKVFLNNALAGIVSCIVIFPVIPKTV